MSTRLKWVKLTFKKDFRRKNLDRLIAVSERINGFRVETGLWKSSTDTVLLDVRFLHPGLLIYY